VPKNIIECVYERMCVWNACVLCKCLELIIGS
jgi:hypothetical protein